MSILKVKNSSGTWEEVTSIKGDSYNNATTTTDGLMSSTDKTKLDGIFNLIYPIGRGFIDFTDTDYSNYLGFTWVRELVGLTPVGYNADDTDFNTVGKTGGEKTHTLTVDEMPSHNHTYKTSGYAEMDNSSITGLLARGLSNYDTTEFSTCTGGGQAHNNMQPYKVVSYWKRTA